MVISLKNKGLINSWNKIKPSDRADKRMLRNILSEKNDMNLQGNKQKREKMWQLWSAVMIMIVLIGGTLIYANLDGNTNNPVPDYPNQLAEDIERTVDTSIDVIPFDELKQEADLIAQVKVIGKTEEIYSSIPKSIYQLEIEEVFKGDDSKANKQISVLQTGNSKFPFEDGKYDLNEELTYILFLKETVATFKAEYWILNDLTGLFVVEDDLVINLVYWDDSLKEIAMTAQDHIILAGVEHDKEMFRLFEREAFLNKIKNHE